MKINGNSNLESVTDMLCNYILFFHQQIFIELNNNLKKIECFNKMYDEYALFCRTIGKNMRDYLNDDSVPENYETKSLKVDVAKIPLELRCGMLESDSKNLNYEKAHIKLLNDKLINLSKILMNLCFFLENRDGYDKKSLLDINKRILEVLAISREISDTCDKSVVLVDDTINLCEDCDLFYLAAEKLK